MAIRSGSKHMCTGRQLPTNPMGLLISVVDNLLHALKDKA